MVQGHRLGEAVPEGDHPAVPAVGQGRALHRADRPRVHQRDARRDADARQRGAHRPERLRQLLLRGGHCALRVFETNNPIIATVRPPRRPPARPAAVVPATLVRRRAAPARVRPAAPRAVVAARATAPVAARAAAPRVVEATHFGRRFAVVLRDGDGDRAVAHALPVQVADRVLRLLPVLVLDEREALLFTTEQAAAMATAYSSHAECARRGPCRTWRKRAAPQRGCALTKIAFLLDKVVETSHDQRAVVSRRSTHTQGGTGLFRNAQPLCDEQGSDCERERARETGAAENARAPNASVNASEQASLVLREIGSPWDSPGVRFRQTQTWKHCEISQGSAISVILPFRYSAPSLPISNRNQRSLREKNSVSISISCENQINGENTGYFMLVNGVAKRRAWEYWRLLPASEPSQ